MKPNTKIALATLSLTIATFSSTTSAQNTEVLQKPVVCMSLQAFTDGVGEKSEFNEQAIWAGRDVRGTTMYVLTVNKQTGTWTFAQFDANTACILGAGSDAKSYNTAAKKIVF